MDTICRTTSIRAGNYGLSDFDVRNHFVFSGTWDLPFRGNRLKDGWLLANITQLQGGNPLNVTTTSTYNGVAATIRPTVIGPYSTGARCSPDFRQRAVY